MEASKDAKSGNRLVSEHRIQPVLPTRRTGVEKKAPVAARARVMLMPPMAMSNLWARMSDVRLDQMEGMKTGGEGRRNALERAWAMSMSAPM